MVSSFEFTSSEKSEDLRTFSFHYRITFDDTPPLVFEETLHFPPFNTESVSEKGLATMLFDLHIMLGVSYWKLFCPPTIVIKTGRLTQKQAEFWNTVYTKGLGEFFYQNKIDFRDLVNFPFDKTAQAIRYTLRLQKRTLLGLGGGKDSLITADLLRKDSRPTTAFIIETSNQSQLIKRQLEVLSLDSIVVKRTLDPQLLAGVAGSYRGHIPFSAITAFIGIVACVFYDFQSLAVGNERSADAGNVDYLGTEINHQWSKSSEFEALFSAYIHENYSEELDYISPVRPLSELSIAQFLSEKPAYLDIFSSCNRNFTIGNKRADLSWCGTCPKCAFTFLLMAAFLPKMNFAGSSGIFGKDLLANPQLLPLYKELLGETGVKPFECVGTPDEAKAAFYLAHQRGEFGDSPIMNYFVAHVLPKIKNREELVKKELTPR